MIMEIAHTGRTGKDTSITFDTDRKMFCYGRGWHDVFIYAERTRDVENVVRNLKDIGYREVSCEDMNTKEILLELLVNKIPSDPNEFNSETGYGEPQHWMALPYDRSLEIVYEETGDEYRYYSWRVHCNETEFDNDDFHSTMGVIDENDSDDLNFDTRVKMLNWAITVALKKPRSY